MSRVASIGRMYRRKTEFEAHFLNVDHGDCTILHHPGDDDHPAGRVSVVDINDWKHRQDHGVAGLSYYLKNFLGETDPDSEVEYARRFLDHPVEYFHDNIEDGGEGIWRFIATHPDMDHLSGLARLDDEVEITEFWDTFHRKTLSADPADWPERFDPGDWKRYEKIRHGETGHHYIQPTKGTKESTWKDDDIDILHPSPWYIQRLNEKNATRAKQRYNDASYVLKVNTPAGGILLPGDLESDEAWERLLRYAGDELEDVRILKAAHHGRNNGFNRKAVRRIDPDYVIMSVGKKDEHDAQSKYKRFCSDDTQIYSTRQHGSIKVTVTEDGNLEVEVEHSNGIFKLPK